MSRKKAREAAVKLLYHWDMVGYENDGFTTTLDETIERVDLTADDDQYIQSVIDGVQDNQITIDSNIEDESLGWKIGRFPKVDLAILRLGVFELLFRPDIPHAVTINECVDIAKHYSTDNSSAFINGVLSTILKKNGKPTCQSSE